MKRFFSYIFSRGNWSLFFIVFFINIFGLINYIWVTEPTLSPPQIFVEWPALIYLYMFFGMALGLLGNLCLLILIFRLIRFIAKPILELLLSILSKIFSNQNFERLEKVIKSQKPNIKKANKEISFLKKNDKNFFWIAPILVMVIGILPLPYGFYYILKIIVSGCALYFVLKFYKNRKKNALRLWLFGFIVILYIPFFPAPIGDKGLWILINIPTIYFFYINRKHV